jgi:hypothetical protein
MEPCKEALSKHGFEESEADSFVQTLRRGKIVWRLSLTLPPLPFIFVGGILSQNEGMASNADPPCRLIGLRP